MDLEILVTGMAIGIAVSAPVGPVNVMAIQKALRFGFWSGLAAGFGAVVADGLFAAAAAFGVTAVSQFISGHQIFIQAVGGILLLGFGLLTTRMHPHLEDSDSGTAGRLRGLLAGFFMTLTNPGAVLGSIAIIGALGPLAPKAGDYAGAMVLVAGVIAGGVVWWAIVAGVATQLRERMSDIWLDRINRIAGAALVIGGVAVLGHLAYVLLT